MTGGTGPPPCTTRPTDASHSPEALGGPTWALYHYYGGFYAASRADGSAVRGCVVTATATDADGGAGHPYVGRAGASAELYNDFQTGPGPGPAWSGGSLTGEPHTSNRYLSSGGDVTLALSKLPGHTTLRGSFNLYVLNEWDDKAFRLSATPSGGQSATLFEQVFNTAESPYGYDDRAGPSRTPPPPGEPAADDGYGPNGDEAYRVEFEFLDASSELELKFEGVGLGALSNQTPQQWGIDDLRIEATKDLAVTLDGLPDGPHVTPNKTDPGAFIPVSPDTSESADPASVNFVPLTVRRPSWLAADKVKLGVSGEGSDAVEVWRFRSTAAGQRVEKDSPLPDLGQVGTYDVTANQATAARAPLDFVVKAESPAHVAVHMIAARNPVPTRPAPGQNTPATDRAAGTPTRPDIRVDANRDGEIRFDDPEDRATPDHPYRFWLNDDHEGVTPAVRILGFGSPAEQDDFQVDAAHPADNSDQRVRLRRDLEDFSRVQIRFDPNMPYDDVLLRFTEVGAGTAPAVRLFRAVQPDDAYLTDRRVADQQIAATAAEPGGAPLEVVAGRDTVVPRDVFERYLTPRDNPANPRLAAFLFEGVAAGRGNLQVVFRQGGGQVGASETYLDLQRVSRMYEHYTAGDFTDRDRAPAVTATPTADSGTYGRPETEHDRDYILFVHGWRLTPFGRRAFSDTAFKRLWWSGYRGRFGSFSWPTEYRDSPPTTMDFAGRRQRLDFALNYRRSELQAFRSAPALRGLLADLNATYPDRVRVMAHSMGNTVVSEALRLEVTDTNQPRPRRLVNTYVASQAAFAADAYDITAPRAVEEFSPFGKDLAPVRTVADLRTPNFYANDPTTNRPYFAGIGAAAGRLVNYFNPQDAVLNNWLQMQWAKDLPVDYGADARQAYVDDSFFNPEDGKFHRSRNDPAPLAWGDQRDDPGQRAARYEIMTHFIQARTTALGRSPVAVGEGVLFQDQLNLATLQPAMEPNYTDHSGQFRSDNMTRRDYWRNLRRTFGV